MGDRRRWLAAALAMALAGCGSDAAAPADAGADAFQRPDAPDVADAAAPDASDDLGPPDDADPQDGAGDAVAACTFVPGSAPAVTTTTFPCATTAPSWASCPARFPAVAALAELCGRDFPLSDAPVAGRTRPEVVLGGTCGGQQVVILDVAPGRGLECHYDGAGTLLGMAFFAEARVYCGRTSAAAAAGGVTSAPCLLDQEASWERVACDEVTPPACGDAGAP